MPDAPWHEDKIAGAGHEGAITDEELQCTRDQIEDLISVVGLVGARSSTRWH